MKQLAAVLVVLASGSAVAKPPVPTRAPTAPEPVRRDGAHARALINHAGELRPAREAVGRREEPLTLEEQTAKEIEKILRGPLRYSTTGLFVADAKTGEPLFAVNADDPLNPASNVKMISTATALELLGADFQYPTRLLGPAAENGVVHGDVYLLGSHDPTLTLADLDDIAQAAHARGITEIDGAIVVGADPTRDGIYRAIIPIEIKGGTANGPPVATMPDGLDALVTVKMTAKTGAGPARARLGYKVESTFEAGRPHVVVTVSGTIGKGSETMYPLVTRERTATAAYGMRAALRAHGVVFTGDMKLAELGDFVGEAATVGRLPIELGRHDSARLAEIIARINKWSINWLADRVIMTAAALVKRQPPSMELALDAMYEWLARHPRIAKQDLTVDTGSGLSYHTKITAHELVDILRSAAGFAADADSSLSHAWLDSLSIGGTDGTLSHRFRTSDMRGHLHAKTGSLSTVIALSGILDVDPQRPLAFSLVTNGDSPLQQGYVRKTHEQLVALLCRYVASTRKGPAPTFTAPTPLAPPTVTPAKAPLPDDLEETEPDSALDAEAAGHQP